MRLCDILFKDYSYYYLLSYDFLPKQLEGCFRFLFLMSGLALSNRVNYIKHMNLVCDKLNGEWNLTDLFNLQNKIESQKDPNQILLKIMVPNLSRLAKKNFLTESKRNLALLALSTRAFRLKYKNLPGNLNELVTKFITFIRIDCVLMGKS